jgi:filamentous hemagglutinin family protein
VLHQAAVLGELIDDELLGEVTGQSPTQIANTLREAVAHQVLVANQSGVRFPARARS